MQLKLQSKLGEWSVRLNAFPRQLLVFLYFTQYSWHIVINDHWRMAVLIYF